MRAPISSRKHYVQKTEFTVASATVTSHTVVEAVSMASVVGAEDVVEGSVIKAVFVEMWLLGNDVNRTSFILAVEKQVGNINNPTFSQMTSLDGYGNKKNILFTSQGLLAAGSGSSAGNPTPILRQWIKVPKGKQRFGLLDRFKIHIATLGADDVVGCGLYVYKSYN